jgi:hypothetical protein
MTSFENYQFHHNLSFLYRFIPESPRWLFSTGQTKEAARLLEKAAIYNKREVPSKILEEVTIEKKEAGKIWLLFSDRRLAVRTVIIYYNWYCLCCQYFTHKLLKQIYTCMCFLQKMAHFDLFARYTFFRIKKRLIYRYSESSKRLVSSHIDL